MRIMEKTIICMKMFSYRDEKGFTTELIDYCIGCRKYGNVDCNIAIISCKDASIFKCSEYEEKQKG